MEIEKKYLVNQVPSLEHFESKKIVQGYISTDPVIRIRQLGDAYSVCMKSHGHMIRDEFEMPITQEQFEALWPKVSYTPIEKTRYFIPLPNGLTAELDIYYGELNELMTVEVEFKSSHQATYFTPPTWFGKDITLDNRFKNNNLALYGNPLAIH